MSIAVLTLAALSFLFASLLVLAHRKLHVDEDPRIDAALQMLPGTNCGACGFPGCLGLAEAMAGGQALDLGAVGATIQLAELETMHRLKTGALIHASVTTPCILAAADKGTQERISIYGQRIGLAFQIHDDILDVTGDSQVIGKNTQADAALDKPTFPSLLGLEASRERAISLRNEAINALRGVEGDTSTLAWLADYVVTRDR